jgi:hypothetical protein
VATAVDGGTGNMPPKYSKKFQNQKEAWLVGVEKRRIETEKRLGLGQPIDPLYFWKHKDE